MNPVYYLRDRIRGWLPQEPRQPEKRAKINLSSPNPSTPILLRVSGLLLSAVGVLLMAMVGFSALVYVSFGFNFGVFGSLLPISFVTGIAFAVAGMTIAAYSVQSNGRFLRKPCLMAGLTLLTLSISATIFEFLEEFLEATRMTLGGFVQLFIALIEPYDAYFSVAAFAGGLILFLGLFKWSPLPSLLKKSYYALAIGAVISLVSALISLFNLYPATGPALSLITVWINPAYLFNFVLYPTGFIGLVLGWAGVFSISIKKRRFLLPTLFTLILAIALFLSIVSI